jgi:hypothetical protein
VSYALSEESVQQVKRWPLAQNINDRYAGSVIVPLPSPRFGYAPTFHFVEVFLGSDIPMVGLFNWKFRSLNEFDAAEGTVTLVDESIMFVEPC